jgi:tellurite resistance protein
MSIAKLLPARAVPDEQAEILLELAFLMTAADGKLRAAEVDAYRQIAAHVRGSGAKESADVLAQRFARIKPSEVPGRVRAIGPKLAPDLRETAFKLAMGLALVDEEGSPEEDDLVSVFVQALGLDLNRAETLAEEARNAFGLE